MDTDMAPDDWAAILFTAKRNDINIKAIAISGTGEAHGEIGAKNCLRLLKIIDKEETPVSYGDSKPLNCTHRFPRIIRFAVDRRLFIKFPKTKQKPKEIKAIELMYQTIDSSSEKIILLAIGPLTNIGNLLQKYPQVKEKIERIYIMGGAIDVKGNIQDVSKSIENPFAEWNIYCDPHAANIVFQSGISIVLIPLDVTNTLPITPEFVHKLKQNQDNNICKFLVKIMKRFGKRIEKGNIALWDLIAAVIIKAEDIYKTETRHIRVIEREGSESGRLVDDLKDGAKIEVCKEIDKEEYNSRFFKTILS
ncbi:MAG: nucleoside hydrolase [Promethearchaeati archaeon]